MSLPGRPTFDNAGILPYVQNGALTFYWGAGTGGTPQRYLISSLQDSNSPYSVNFPAASYTATGLTNGRLYTYSIHASNATGLSPSSLYIMVQPGLPPNGPINVQVSTINISSAKLSWTAATTLDTSIIRGYAINGVPAGQIVNMQTVPLPTSSFPLSIEPFRNTVNIFFNNQPSSLIVQAVTDGGYSPAAYAPFIKNDYAMRVEPYMLKDGYITDVTSTYTFSTVGTGASLNAANLVLNFNGGQSLQGPTFSSLSNYTLSTWSRLGSAAFISQVLLGDNNTTYYLNVPVIGNSVYPFINYPSSAGVCFGGTGIPGTNGQNGANYSSKIGGLGGAPGNPAGGGGGGGFGGGGGGISSLGAGGGGSFTIGGTIFLGSFCNAYVNVKNTGSFGYGGCAVNYTNGNTYSPIGCNGAVVFSFFSNYFSNAPDQIYRTPGNLTAITVPQYTNFITVNAWGGGGGGTSLYGGQTYSFGGAGACVTQSFPYAAGLPVYYFVGGGGGGVSTSAGALGGAGGGGAGGQGGTGGTGGGGGGSGSAHGGGGGGTAGNGQNGGAGGSAGGGGGGVGTAGTAGNIAINGNGALGGIGGNSSGGQGGGGYGGNGGVRGFNGDNNAAIGGTTFYAGGGGGGGIGAPGGNGGNVINGSGSSRGGGGGGGGGGVAGAGGGGASYVVLGGNIILVAGGGGGNSYSVNTNAAVFPSVSSAPAAGQNAFGFFSGSNGIPMGLSTVANTYSNIPFTSSIIGQGGFSNLSVGGGGGYGGGALLSLSTNVYAAAGGGSFTTTGTIYNGFFSSPGNYLNTKYDPNQFFGVGSFKANSTAANAAGCNGGAIMSFFSTTATNTLGSNAPDQYISTIGFTTLTIPNFTRQVTASVYGAGGANNNLTIYGGGGGASVTQDITFSNGIPSSLVVFVGQGGLYTQSTILGNGSFGGGGASALFYNNACVLIAGGGGGAMTQAGGGGGQSISTTVGGNTYIAYAGANGLGGITTSPSTTLTAKGYNSMVVYPTTQFNQSSMTNVTMTYNAPVVSLYSNGALQGSGIYPIPSSIVSSTTFQFGSTFTGSIGETLIYTRTMDAQEVQTTFNATKGQYGY